MPSSSLRPRRPRPSPIGSGHLELFGERGDALIPIVNGVREAIEGLPPSLMAVRTEADEAFIAMRERIDEGVAAFFRLRDALGGPMTAAVREFDTLTDEVLRDLQGNFSTFIEQAISGSANLGDAVTALGETLQASLADFLSSKVVKEFTEFFATKPGETAAVLEGAHGLLREFSTRFAEEGATLVSAFERLSTQSLQTAQAFAAAAGAVVGALASQGLFGSGSGASTGSSVGGAVGGVAGLAIGGFFGGPGGAVIGGFVGSVLGSMLGGFIGSFFDDDDVRKEIRTKISQTLEQAVMGGFASGVKLALETGDIDAGFDLFKQSVEAAVLDGLIAAFAQQVVIRSLLAPFSVIFADMMVDGMTAANQDRFKAALQDLRVNLKAWRPIWADFIRALQGVFPELSKVEESTRATSRHTEVSAENTTIMAEQTRAIETGQAKITDTTRESAEHTRTIVESLTQMLPPTDTLVTAQQAIAETWMPLQVTAWDEVLKRTGQVEEQTGGHCGHRDHDPDRLRRPPAQPPGRGRGWERRERGWGWLPARPARRFRARPPRRPPPGHGPRRRGGGHAEPGGGDPPGAAGARGERSGGPGAHARAEPVCSWSRTS